MPEAQGRIAASLPWDDSPPRDRRPPDDNGPRRKRFGKGTLRGSHDHNRSRSRSRSYYPGDDGYDNSSHNDHYKYNDNDNHNYYGNDSYNNGSGARRFTKRAAKRLPFRLGFGGFGGAGFSGAGGSKGRDRGREEEQEHTTSSRSPPPLSPESSRNNDWEHEKGAQQAQGYGDERGRGFGGMKPRAEKGGEGEEGGGRRESHEGNAGEEYGLEDLTRQELQSLAKKTDGLVRANLSTPRIIRGLRDCGYASDATDHQ